MNQIISSLYDEYLNLTEGNPSAAATLVLAQLQSTPPMKQDAAAETTTEYLTVKQAAERFAICKQSIYRLIGDGLPVIRVRNSIRIKRRDLERFLADSETKLR